MTISKIAKVAALGGAIVALSATVASASVATASVNVRSGPSTSYRVVDTLRPGEHVDVIRQSGGWCRIDHTGPDGWVSCAYLANSGDRYYRDSPNITLRFGFGNDRYYRPHRPPMHWNGGPGWYGNHGPSFGFSFGN